MQLPLHAEKLEAALSLFRNDPSVIGIVLGGSFAVGTPDEYSDLDLYLVIEDADFTDVFNKRETRARSLGNPLSWFVADHNPAGQHDHIVLYDDFVKIDFIYLRRSELPLYGKFRQFRVLHDPVGAVHGSLSEQAKPSYGKVDIAITNQKFWGWVWYTFGKLMRGEIWEALEATAFMRAHALIPLINAKNELGNEGFRRLEQKLDAYTAARLQTTVSAYSCDSVYRALMQEIMLFCELRDELLGTTRDKIDKQAEEKILIRMKMLWAQR